MATSSSSASTSEAGRLFVDGRDVAEVAVAATRAARRRGLLERSGVEGALWFPRTSWIHTFRMRFAIDVAWCDRAGSVLAAATVAPDRLTAPVWRARAVIEAEAGAFAAWGIALGSHLTVARPEALRP